MASTPQEYKRDVRACERLWSSVSTYLRGIGLYGSNYTGDLENSFSTLYKAWDQLWQADRTSHHNHTNGDFLKTSDYIFGLTDYMNAVEETALNGEALDEYLHYLLNNQIEPKPYKYQAEIPENNSPDADIFRGYDYRLAAPLFRKIHHKQHPVRINLLLLKTIRNYDQHDRIEENTKSNSILISAMNPYITANAFNYYEAYLDIYKKVSIDCSNHCRGRPKCHFSSLPHPSKVIMDIKIPTSLPHAQLLSGEFSIKVENVNPNKQREPINYRMLAEQTSLGWKISAAIKTHDVLFKNSSEESGSSLFKVIWNQDPFANPLNNASYKAAYKVGNKDPKEIGSNDALGKLKKKISEELFKQLKSITNDSNFPYIIKFYEKSDSLAFDEINSALLKAAIKAYGYKSLAEVVVDLNTAPDFPFIANIRLVTNALTKLKEEDKEEFDTMKMDFFGEPRYHFKLLHYLKRYNTESKYLEICKNPTYKEK